MESAQRQPRPRQRLLSSSTGLLAMCTGSSGPLLMCGSSRQGMLTTPRSTAKEAVRGTKHAACAAGAEHWSAMDASQACMYPECLHVAGLLNPPTISWREVSGRRHLHHRQLRRRQGLPTGSQLAEQWSSRKATWSPAAFGSWWTMSSSRVAS